VLHVRARQTPPRGAGDERYGRAGRSPDTTVRELLAAHDAELQRIARDLHDVAGQALIGVRLMLDGIRRDPSRVDAELEQSISAIDVAMRDIRELAMDVRPAGLDDLGLAAAVRTHTARMGRFGGLRTYVTTDILPDDLDPAIASACVRILQEALTNVIRHAQATRVRVVLRSDAEVLRLKIEDNGVGMVVSKRRAASARRADVGMGVIGMTERATLVGGRLEITTSRSGGTRIDAHLPTHANLTDLAPT
jgi:signal transduction histidine kinase